jgi:hypothetical protein
VTTERVERDMARLTSDAANPTRVASTVAADGTRRGYARPRLRALGCAAELLEVLGPAQANYGVP